MNKKDSRLWLKLDRVRKELYHVQYNYIGTEDHKIITDMISYIKTLIKNIENSE